MIGHLGNRVSALLDGQLSPAEEERAWEHVHVCPTCRDHVEREGWVKTRLASLTYGSISPEAPDDLRASLLGASGGLPLRGDELMMLAARPRRHTGLVAIGGTAVGVAVVGVLALGAAPAEAPIPDRRVPTTSLVRQLDQPGPGRATPTGAVQKARELIDGVKIVQ